MLKALAGKGLDTLGGEFAPGVMFGHAIHVAWCWLMFTGSLFLTPGGELIHVPWLQDPLYALSLGANAAVLTAFALGRTTGDPLFKKPGLAATAMILMSVGCLFASNYVTSLFGQPTAAVEALAGIMTGAGTSMFLLMWGRSWYHSGRVAA